MKASLALFGLGLLALANLSSQQASRWQGGSALWRPVVNANPGLPLAHNYLASELLFRGEAARAARVYAAAPGIAGQPGMLQNYAVALMQSGRPADAECLLVRGVAARHPGAALAYVSLLVAQPDYIPRHPLWAAGALLRVSEQIGRGALSVDPAMRARIPQVLRALDPPAHFIAPKPPSCEALKRAEL